MGDLIKRLFYPRKDFVKIIEMRGYANLDEFTLNKFIKKVNDIRGKIIKIDTIQKLNAERWYDDGTYSDVKGQGTATSSDNYFLIHYKTLSKIEYIPSKDEECIKLFHEIRQKQIEDKIKK